MSWEYGVMERSTGECLQMFTMNGGVLVRGNKLLEKYHGEAFLADLLYPRDYVYFDGVTDWIPITRSLRIYLAAQCEVLRPRLEAVRAELGPEGLAEWARRQSESVGCASWERTDWDPRWEFIALATDLLEFMEAAQSPPAGRIIGAP